MRKPVLLLLALSLLASSARAAIDPGLLAGMSARSIGPAGMSGRVPAVSAAESNPNTVYIGAAAGGVWKSTNGGITWTPVFDDQQVSSIGAVAVAPSNPDVVWVGTGEGNPRNSVSVGDGVYRSLDGGKTWAHLGLEKTERITRIVVHPTNPDVAWVAALGQEWGENAERGIYKTEDGGKTWSRVLHVDPRTGAADLVIDPRNPNKLFASMWQYRRWPYYFKSGGPGSGLFVTYDGGRAWKRYAESEGMPKGDLGRIGIAISRSNPDVVYATVEAAKSAVIRSDDGGRSWQTVNERYDANPRPFYFAHLRVDPALPNRVYAIDFNIRLSEDGGKTFDNLAGVSGIHGDFHDMWIDPNDPSWIYFTNDGGVAVSHDRGKTARFATTLPLGQFYHVAVDNETPYNVYGGLQDNSSWRGPNTVWQQGGIRSHEWKPLVGGDGFETRPDIADSNLTYTMSQGGEIIRYDLRTGETRAIKPAPPEGTKLRFNWNAGFATDPLEAGTIYIGSQFLHKSTDRGETWTAISPDLTTNNPDWQHQEVSGGLTRDVSNAENYTTILAVAPSPLQKGVIWVGTDDGRLHVTRDGGKTWTSLEKNVPGVPANTWIPNILASKFDAASAFVVFDNHRREDFKTYVYRTNDWGKTWKSVATADLRGYAHVIEQDPGDKNLLFLGTEFGLWVSNDGGARWMRWTHGVPPAPVMGLAIQPRELDLVIGTHGRSVYVIDDIRPLRTLSEKTVSEPVHLYDSGPAQQHWFAGEPGGFGLGSGEYRGDNEPYGAILTYSLSAPGLPYPDEKKERERKEEERQGHLREEQGRPVTGIPQTPQELRESETPGKTTPAEKAGAAGKTSGKAPEKTPEKPKAEEPKEVEIRIADTSGKTLRTFTAPARQGVSRAVWDLTTDSPKQFPSDRPAMPHPSSGVEVIPGTYTATIKMGDHEAKGTVQVVADPRSKNTEEGWKARDAAVQRCEALLGALAEAAERIRNTKADVDTVVARVQAQKKDKEKDQPPAKDAKPDPLVESANKLKEGLDKLEMRLWTPYDAVGIQPGTDAATRVFYAFGYTLSSMAPPSPTHLEYLRQAEKTVNDALADVNRFFETDVAAFRKQADAAGARLLPDLGKVEVKRP
ncbi:MAG: VPS10 domain-containing protein [Thermoanaerobaculia bacterium]